MSMTLSLKPMGKPRQSQSDKWRLRPVVCRYRSYADALRASFHLLPLAKFLQVGRVTVIATFMTKCSDRYGKPHRQKPDADNIMKGVKDSLIRKDETVYWELTEKRWGEQDSLKIILEEVVYAETDLSG